MAYFQAMGWGPMPSTPPAPDPITSAITSLTSWMDRNAPPPAPPPPSTSSMFAIANKVSGAAPAPGAPSSAGWSRPVPANVDVRRAGMSTGLKVALGLGAAGLLYLVVR